MDGRPASEFMIGVNYWPRKTNLRMWKDFNINDIEDDLNIIKRIGIDYLRIFLLSEDFLNSDGLVNDCSINKLKIFLEACRKRDLNVFLTFIIGHMSGKNFNVPWESGNGFYTSAGIEKFAKYVLTVVKNVLNYDNIKGWILSNELTIFKRPNRNEQARLLQRTFYLTVKSLAPNSLISSGDVLSDLQYPDKVHDLTDYSGLHLYFYDDDLIRHRTNYGSLINVYSGGKFPVLLEEFGFSSSQFSDESIARFVYEILWTAYVNGAIGAFYWCFSDFNAEYDEPYDWRPLELGFGLVKSDGTLKTAARVFNIFKNEISKFQNYKRSRPEINVIIPFFTFKDYTSIPESYGRLFRSIPGPLLSSLQMSKSFNIQADARYEEFGLEPSKLYIIPSAPVIKASTWRSLQTIIDNNKSCLYASTFHGSWEVSNFHDSFTHLWKEIFGVSNVTVAGSKGIHIKNDFKIKFVNNFGNYSKDDEIKIYNAELWTYNIKCENAYPIIVSENGDTLMAARNDNKSIISVIPFEYLHSRDIIAGNELFKIYKSIFEFLNLDINSSNYGIEYSKMNNDYVTIEFAIKHDPSILYYDSIHDNKNVIIDPYKLHI
ncbi:glycoside hydrolase 5 family protein [Picrophilus oshimae]|uniref:Glycosyl hydrolase family 5 protein n=1 Tax=Picrophilus torridus (strain ATCC 700027 / DSM 9790 / JCM 10055 / NBRC 100828 / KAW 2/3) TaxID=1122961 RepID=Q6KZ15_PICTO|nr:cellulase family glycosylhydrolase [Picrophilus oshimae]AAT44037.1 glycosyl hydrolase family 5 protein [Picrophilus oshimae DSM 9789]